MTIAQTKSTGDCACPEGRGAAIDRLQTATKKREEIEKRGESKGSKGKKHKKNDRR